MSARFARISFAFRFAYRNIIWYRLRSLLILFSFTALFTALLIGFSMPDYFQDYYYGRLEQRYRDIDLVMRASPNSNTRFFSLRTLTDDAIADHITDYAPFFEVDTLVAIEDETELYVKAMASTSKELARITGLDIPDIGPEETVLTESVARQYGVLVGDTIDMVIGEADQELEVVAIVSDQGLFAGDAIFIDREASLRLFLLAIDSPYADASWVLLENIYNTVYFSLTEDSDYEQARTELKDIEALSNLEFAETIDTRAVDQLVRRATSVFNVIFVIIVFSILFVLQTTFLLFFSDKRRAFGITAILGGRRPFSYSVALIEIATFYALSLLTSLWLSNRIIREGSDYVGTGLRYRIKDENILLSASIVLLLFLIVSYYYFRSFDRQSSVANTQNRERAKPLIPFLSLVFFASLSGYLFLSLSVGYRLLGSSRAILQILFVGIILFSLSRVLVEAFVSLYRKPKTGTLYLKTLLAKKDFYRYLQVLVISILSV
ncbi:MAG: ABC transporter permease, partial [Acholeplasmataceae bacterium]